MSAAAEESVKPHPFVSLRSAFNIKIPRAEIAHFLYNRTMSKNKLVPVYITNGDVEAYLGFPYLYNRSGDWIGYVTRERDVYSVHGNYAGWLTDIPRVLRKRSYNYDKPKRPLPFSVLPRIRVPATAPLAPMMPELDFSTLDVLQEYPELLPTSDAGEFLQDMD